MELVRPNVIKPESGRLLISGYGLCNMAIFKLKWAHSKRVEQNCIIIEMNKLHPHYESLLGLGEVW
jgi:hypothetical protein